MLEKIKRFLSNHMGFASDEASAEEIAALVRAISYGYESQDVLFEPENEKCLMAFVEYGHEIAPKHINRFFETAPSRAVMFYLERGEGISDENVKVILNRNDEMLTKALLNSRSWVPFPYGCSMKQPGGVHLSDEEFLSLV